jgi:hypothetical protein
VRENPEYVTPRELYDKVDAVESKLEDKIDSNHREVMDFVGKSKVAFAVIGVLVASPKLGGPTAEQLITGALRFVGT